MKISFDCLPCSLRQVLEASRLATDDVAVQDEIIKEALGLLAGYQNYSYAPTLARSMQLIVKKHTGVEDPYAAIKKRDIEAAQTIYPMLKQFLQEKENSLYWALKIAVTGNVIDAGAYGDVDIKACVRQELIKEFFICDLDVFTEKLPTAKTLLILGDNAGETVFDRILAEYLQPLKIIYAVRSKPILNDATVRDAYASGLDKYTEIMATGCDLPGVVLESCGPEFGDIFSHADIVLSKGQGNWETLENYGRDVFFLLKAKCPVIAKKLNVGLGEYVLKYDDGRSSKRS